MQQKEKCSHSIDTNGLTSTDKNAMLFAFDMHPLTPLYHLHKFHRQILCRFFFLFC